MMQDLGNAINESLSDSDGISGAICDIRDAGYDVFLVLEATIGFSKRSAVAAGAAPAALASGKITWTSSDQQFLKALNIAEE
jgi:hypothetical protein